jgi:hypothetical protein
MTKLKQLMSVRERLDRAIEKEIRATERATPKPDAEELRNQIAQGMAEGVVRILTDRLQCPQEKASATPPGKLHLVRTNQRVVRHRSAAPIDSTPKPPAC